MVLKELKKALEEKIQQTLQEILISSRAGGKLKGSDEFKEFCLRKGKRIRPLLFILSYLGHSGHDIDQPVPPDVLKSAAGLELLHTFAIIHDDLLDNSTIRRHGPTLQHALNNRHVSLIETRNRSIIWGDLLYAGAIRMFSSIQVPSQHVNQAVEFILKVSERTCTGQLLDVSNNSETTKNWSLFEMMRFYDLKTALYSFACPLVSGAILAGAESEIFLALYKAGLYLGRAFQILDDISEIPSNKKSISNSTLQSQVTLWSDFDNNRPTILFWHSPQKWTNKKDPVEVINSLNESGSLAFAEELLRNNIRKGLRELGESRMKKVYLQNIELLLKSLFKDS